MKKGANDFFNHSRFQMKIKIKMKPQIDTDEHGFIF